MITSLVTAVAAASAIVALPTIDCARQPYGVSGCEAYLGAVVRQQEGVGMPSLTDAELGRVIQRLCFGEPYGEIVATGSQSEQRELKYNLSYLNRIKSPYCG